VPRQPSISPAWRLPGPDSNPSPRPRRPTSFPSSAPRPPSAPAPRPPPRGGGGAAMQGLLVVCARVYRCGGASRRYLLLHPELAAADPSTTVDGVVKASDGGRGSSGQRRSGAPSWRLLPCFSNMAVGCTSATVTRAWRSRGGGQLRRRQLIFFSSPSLLLVRHKTASRGSHELSFPVSRCLRGI
jgi:hypothetical protein